MSTILLQIPLPLQEFTQLKAEFPQYTIVANSNATDLISPKILADVEIFYGNCLAQEQLDLAKELRWIHSPSLALNALCLAEAIQRGNVLVTIASEENVEQTAEFVLGGILAYAKNLFYWYEVSKHSKASWDDMQRNTVWTLSQRNLLQVGLGKTGTEIARLAQQAHLRVRGVLKEASFHPYCKQTFSYKDLRSALPDADIVSICLPHDEVHKNVMGAEEFALMKQDAVLILVGSHDIVNADALAAEVNKGKFRGVLIDIASFPIPEDDWPLWHLPGVIITPDVAPHPKKIDRSTFQLFHYNLRQYAYGNIDDMHNRVVGEPLAV